MPFKDAHSRIADEHSLIANKPLVILLNPFVVKYKDILDELLTCYRAVAVFEKGSNYTLKDNTLIQLTHTIVVRNVHESDDALCYFVLSNQLVGKGGFGHVFDLEGTVCYDAMEQQFLCVPISEALGQWVVKDFVKSQPGLLRPMKNIQFSYYAQKEALGSLSCPNLKASPLFGDEAHKYLLLKKHIGKEFFYFIEGAHEPAISIVRRVEWSFLLIQALYEQIHQFGIVHGDVKLENILFEDKIGAYPNYIDLGSVERNETPATGLVLGTSGFIAPEYKIKGSLITYKADVFSLGRVLFLIFGIFDFYPVKVTNIPFIQALNTREQAQLKSALHSMTDNTVALRWSLKEANNYFRTLLIKLKPDSWILEGKNTPKSNLLSPYYFFSSKTALEVMLIKERTFSTLLKHSIDIYKQHRTREANADYLALIDACLTPFELMMLIIQHKNAKSTPFRADSFICYFFNEAQKYGLFEDLAKELALPAIHISYLLLEQPIQRNMFFCFRRNRDNNTITPNSERERLYNALESYVVSSIETLKITGK